ncbi:TetR/AcrR family transcriptional regulator [Nocardia lijiangensis]|uniref:TetR/AcrR family transcriptional regulator n=1 Tax=Nocardia lijiangensis TaxID=299618 RepID=UPI00082B2EA5|nr:TetR/AcrR family transcriptional regulator [Nocardia lijiangensis]
MVVDTRDRILAAAADLFKRQGLPGTGLKQIAATAGAPMSSIYHFFPGGKTELAEEVIRTSGAAYGAHVIAIFDACPDLLTAIRTAFDAAAHVMVESDFVETCPIATIALEVAATDETLRIATADVFTDWIQAGAESIENSGLPLDVRRRLFVGFVNSLEGAFILSRSMRSTEPLRSACHMMLLAAQAELADHHAPRSQ